MKRPVAIVTGGAGFIGSHMVDHLLERRYRVRVIDNLAGGHERNLAHHAGNSDLDFERLDIRRLDENSALFADARFVFHFAGIGDIVPSIERPTEYMDVNVQVPSGCSKQPGRQAWQSWSTPLRPRATDWRQHRRARITHSPHNTRTRSRSGWVSRQPSTGIRSTGFR